MMWSLIIQLFFSYLIFVSLVIIYTLIRIFKNFKISKILKIDLQERYGSWAVVTGCTRGIGRAYANELARRGINIFLISIGMEDLIETSKELSLKYGVETEILEVNFMDGIEIYKKIENKLRQKKIGILVNNVGVGVTKFGPFSTLPESEILTHISVNITAATLMTKIILPHMIQNGKGAIVNVSSMAGCCPMSYLSTYSASKAYIRFFSKSLRDELRGSKITIQTLTPFFVLTAMAKGFKGMEKPSIFIPLPEVFASSAISTLGYTNETCGYAPHEILAILLWLSPEWITIRFMGQIHKNLNPEESKTK